MSGLAKQVMIKPLSRVLHPDTEKIVRLPVLVEDVSAGMIVALRSAINQSIQNASVSETNPREE